APRPAAKIIFCTFCCRASSPKTSPATDWRQKKSRNTATNSSGHPNAKPRITQIVGRGFDSSLESRRRAADASLPLAQRTALTQQFHDRDDHVDYRPGCCRNDKTKRDHFFGPFARSLDTKFAS